MRKLSGLIAVFMLSFGCTRVLGQEVRGSVLGRVTDATGAVVPGVNIKVINLETRVTSETVTNDEGNYKVPFLSPGNFSVTAELTGFKKIERTGVRVSVGSDVTVNFALEVGGIGETVTVSGAASQLDASTADLGQVVEKNHIENTQTNLVRNVLARLEVTASLTQLRTGATGTGTTYTSSGQSDFSISGGGGKGGGNEIMVDGVPNTVPSGAGGIALFIPSLDMTDEVKVHTTMFDASLGHSTGGAVNIITRGGTSEYHGAAFGYKRFKELDSNSWTNNRLNIPLGNAKYGQYGGIFGGPLRLPHLYDGRGRTFFLFSYETDDEIRGGDAPDLFRVPTALERKGDFSQTLNQQGTGILRIYDPLTTVGTGANATRVAFPNSVIPASRLMQTGLAVANLYPLPNMEGTPRIGAYNWSVTSTTQVTQSQFSIRADQIISNRQRVFGRFSRMYRKTLGAERFPGASGANDSGNTFDSVALDDTITFSPTFTGSLRYGFAERYSYSEPQGTLQDPASLLLADAILQNQFTRGLPVFNLGESVPTVGDSESHGRLYSHTLLSTFNKVLGRHTLKFGSDYRLFRNNDINPGGSQSGTFTYSPTFTQANPFVASSRNESGTAFASLLMGIPDSGSIGFVSPRSLQNHYLALFLQDEWKVLRNLSLNFGLRYELETPYTERYNRVSHGFDFNAQSPISVPGLSLRGGVLFAGVDGNPRRVGRVDGNNFGPRFGFAYSLTDKTVLRGGYGLFYSAQTYATDFSGSVSTFGAVTTYTGTIDSGATPFTTLANPFPGGAVQPKGSTVGLAGQYGDSLVVLDQNRVNPYNQQWQFSIQRQLPWRIALEGAYVGMLSLKQLESFDLNEKPDQYLALGTQENTNVTNPFFGIFSATTPLGRGTTVRQGQLWKRYPQYNAITLQGANTGRAIYHAFDGRVEKRFSDGLNFLVSYSWSKVIQNNTTSIINTRHYRSVSFRDLGHVIKISTVYDLPFGPGTAFSPSSGVLSRLVGGWKISGYFWARSGPPLSVTDVNGRPLIVRDPSKDGSVKDKLGDLVDPATKRVLNPYFDTTAFARLPNQYTISPTSPQLSFLRGPGIFGLNGSLVKITRIKERVKVEFRVDASNVTNSPQFDLQGATVQPQGIGLDFANPATFGVVNQAGFGRKVQLGARVMF
jgi:hypothetical protein